MLIVGFFGALLFAVGDVLLQSFSGEGETLLLILNSSLRDMPLWKLYFTLLSGVIATPALFFGLSAMDSYLTDTGGISKGRMHRWFRFGAVTASLSFFAAHAVCAVLELSLRQALVSGLTPGEANAAFQVPFLLSFAATNVWVTASEIVLSVSFISFVVRGAVPLKKACAWLNTIGVTVIFEILGALLSGLTGNGVFSLLAKSGPSLGVGAMLLGMMAACGKESEEDRR